MTAVCLWSQAYFAIFKKGLKLQLRAVAKMYIVCALMQNAKTCMHGDEAAS